MTLAISWIFMLRMAILPFAQAGATAAELNDKAVKLGDNGEEEESLYKAALQENPGLIEPRFNLALLYLATDRTEKAVVELERGLSKTPTDAELLYVLGLAHASAGNAREAAEALATCLRLKPDWGDASYNLGLLCWNPEGPHGDLGNPVKAEYYWKRTLEVDPTHLRATEALGAISTRQLKYQQAIDVFLKQDPQSLSAGALRNLALCLKKMNRKDEARQFLEMAKQRPGDGASPSATESAASAGTPTPEPGSAAQDSASSSEPPQGSEPAAPSEATAEPGATPAEPQTEDVGKLYVAGLQAYKEGRHVDAVPILSQVASQKPDHREVQWYLASSLLELGKEEEAESHLLLAIQQNDKHPYAYTYLGTLLEKSGRIEEALQMYKKGLEVAPDGLVAPDAQKGIERLQGQGQ